MAHELHLKGVPLNRMLRIYGVKGLTHVTRDVLTDLAEPSDGDAVGVLRERGDS